MLDNNTIIKATNRKKGSIGYTIEDLGISRTFREKETKEVTMEELRKLSWIPGGRALLDNYLLIDNKDAIKELIGDIEPEYNYTEKEIEWLLLHGTNDQLEDCLNFAPLGVIDILKNLAVKLKVDNVSKRKIIEEKTGLNVSKAIEIEEIIEAEDSNEQKEDTRSQRRSNPVILNNNDNKEDRKSSLPNYTVISKK